MFDLHRYYQDELLKILTSESLFVKLQLKVPRSRWQRIKVWVRWRTIGTFRDWLHRDCDLD